MKNKAYYHLPGIYEFYELYRIFLPLFYEHREYFFDWCEIGSVYDAPMDCLWNGGRTGFSCEDPIDVLSLTDKYGISSRLTFSNSLLEITHLSDKKCNELCKLYEADDFAENGVIVHSDLLKDYLLEQYPGLYLISSTTKVITERDALINELKCNDFRYVVPDYGFNKDLEWLNSLNSPLKDKVEFLCNECCPVNCPERKACYENVSRKNLGIDEEDHICINSRNNEGYSFTRAMKNPSFIGISDIQNTYLPMGFTNFKIEGRGLGSAMILEFLLYYMTKPEYHIVVREAIYLDGMLDLF